MTEETNEKLKAIKRSFRTVMNGVASHSMREKGVGYKLNWGVSLVHLREMAATYGKDYDLAIALWKEDIRECKILATLIMPAERLLPEVADIWLEQTTSQELAEMLAAGAALMQADTDFLGGIARIPLVEQVADRGKALSVPALAVHAVVDGNEPHTECGEHTLKIVPHIDVVTAEAGKILDDNAIDFSCLKVGKHSLEGWAVKICAGITVICIMLGNVQFAA